LHKNHRTELLEYLQNNPGWHTSNELAVVIGVSTRSIKRYAKDLVDSSAIFVSNNGYKINQEKQITTVNGSTASLSYDSIERVLVNELTQEKSLNIYDLTEQFYLSESTLLKLMHEVQSYVKAFNLKLTHSGDEWVLHGKEIDKRRVISDILYKESGRTFIGSDSIQDNFADINVKHFADIIKRLARLKDIYLNVFDFNNILLHVVIATHRLKNGYLPQINYSQNETQRPSANEGRQNDLDFEFGSELIEQIEKSERIVFSNEERHSLVLVIQFSITRKHSDLEYNVNHSTAVLVDDLIKYVNSMLNIDLRSLNFREQFAIHIQRLLERSSHGYVERNPMPLRIRESSPIIYECAVLISNRLEEIKKISIDDDEIAYIAMHIGNAVSEYINDLHKLYVIVLIPDYQSDDSNFINRLERLFSQDIVIGGIVHTPEQLEDSKYVRTVDFVVQVNSDYLLQTIRHTNISQFLTQLDYRRISGIIEELKHEQEKNNFAANLRNFFPPENFKIIKNDATRDGIFKKVCSELEKKHVVEKDFLKQLKEREEMSSTAFGKVAIPHSLHMSALKTQGYILLSPKGIKWDNNGSTVNLVFLLAISEANKSSYRNIFDDVSQIAVDAKNVSTLVNTSSYNNFIIQLSELL